MIRKPYSLLTIVLSLLAAAAFALYFTGGTPDVVAKAAVLPNASEATTATAALSPEKAKSAAVTNTPPKGVNAPVQAAPAQPLIVPPGAELHTIAKGETIPGLLRSYLPRTKYLTLSEFEIELRAQNPTIKGLFPKPGTQLVVPGIEPQPIVEKSIPVPRDFEVKAIYLTGAMAGSETGIRIIRRWH